MLDVMVQYLNTATTPELRDTIVDAHQAFDLIGLDEYEGSFEELLLMSDSADIGDLMDRVIELTKAYQTTLLKEHEIVLVDSASLETHTTFIMGILGIQDYNNKAELLKTTLLPLSSNEILAELIALIMTKNADELLINIDTVSDSCIGSIKDMLQEEEASISEAEQDVINARIHTFKKYMEYVGSTLKIATMITNGLRAGFPFVTYLNIFGRDLEELKADEIAKELVGMAILSSDGSNNPISVIKENIDDYIADVDKATKVDIKVSQILMEFKL